jgi:hypothetical protein
VQNRPRQVGNRQQESIRADVQWQQCVQLEGDDRSFFLLGQDRRVRFLRPGRYILNRCAFVPLISSLWVDTKFPTYLRELCLRSLYCRPDGERGPSVPVTNPSNNASFNPCVKVSPSSRGIKRMGSPSRRCGSAWFCEHCRSLSLDPPAGSRFRADCRP